MPLITSLLFGNQGSYNIFGTKVIFDDTPSFTYPCITLKGCGLVSKLATNCMNSYTFRLLTFGYAHIFVHEMGHTLSCKILTNRDSTIRVFKSSCTGGFEYSYPFTALPKWKKIIILAAGPMLNNAFSLCTLIAATAFKNYLSWPLALALGGGAVFWISGELLYAYTSVLNNDSGDYGTIARHGTVPLTLATTALIGQIALGILAAITYAV